MSEALTVLEPPPVADGCVRLVTVEQRLKRMRKSVLTTARLHSQETKGFRPPRAAMCTMTYADVDGYRPRHISDFLHSVRQWLKRRGFSSLRYTWVLELQKRGAPHYHVLFWLPRGLTLPKPDKQGWWKHGWTRIEWARNAVAYIAKYASKGHDLEELQSLPKGSRIMGSGGLSDTGKRERRWWVAPYWVRQRWPEKEYDVFPAIGGGWVARAIGDWCASPWEIVAIGPFGSWVDIKQRVAI